MGDKASQPSFTYGANYSSLGRGLSESAGKLAVEHAWLGSGKAMPSTLQAEVKPSEPYPYLPASDTEQFEKGGNLLCPDGIAKWVTQMCIFSKMRFDQQVLVCGGAS